MFSAVNSIHPNGLRQRLGSTGVHLPEAARADLEGPAEHAVPQAVRHPGGPPVDSDARVDVRQHRPAAGREGDDPLVTGGRRLDP